MRMALALDLLGDVFGRGGINHLRLKKLWIHILLQASFQSKSYKACNPVELTQAQTILDIILVDHLLEQITLERA